MTRPGKLFMSNLRTKLAVESIGVQMQEHHLRSEAAAARNGQAPTESRKQRRARQRIEIKAAMRAMRELAAAPRDPNAGPDAPQWGSAAKLNNAVVHALQKAKRSMG